MHPRNPSTHLLSIVLALVAGFLVAPFSAHAQVACDAEVTGDGVVDAADLAEVLGSWGRCNGCSADVDGSGTIDGFDLAAVLGAWGAACPQIADVNPFSGPTSGGTVITITGTHLAEVTEVTIGGAAATEVVVVDATTVTAVTPAGVSGPKVVAVRSPSGTAELVNGFTYLVGSGSPPTIATVNPPQGPLSGGTIVLISGSEFVAPASVLFGGVPAESVSVIGPTSLNAVVPEGSTGGPVEVSVTTPYGTATLGEGYFYNAAPVITSVLPSSGPYTGGTILEIAGQGFLGAEKVRFGGSTEVYNLQVVSNTLIRVVTPSYAQDTVDVSVVTPWGTGTAPSAYSFVAPPVISSVTPSSGSALGGTLLSIVGSKFTGATGVTVGGALATSVAVLSDTELRVVAPPGVAGAAQDVVVTAPGGTATLASAYTYGLAPVGWATVLQADPDPAVVTDPAIRDAIVATTLPWHVLDDQTQMEMMLIPPGTYEMGCSTPPDGHACFDNEFPVHAVTISYPFYLGRYEVTGEQWIAMMGSNPSSNPVPNGPVNKVSFNTIQGFLAATGMRLPTEAEWEYACRAGTTTAFHGWPAVPEGTNDPSLVGNIGWVNGESVGAQPVGGKAPNGFGLYDMIGNVGELVSDWYGTYPAEAQTDPTGPATGSCQTGPTNDCKVARYTTWLNSAWTCTSSYRDSAPIDEADPNRGFRAVRAPLTPAISGISTPYLEPGMSFEISGEQLGSTTSVEIDGVSAFFQVLGEDTLSVVAPEHAWGGPFNVSLTTAWGAAEGGADNAVYYCEIPSWATIVEVHPDPAVVTDAGIRAAIIATGYPWHVMANNSTGIEMMLIPPGSFQMGCSPSNQHGCESNENPVHAVTLTKPFYIGRYEVTQDQWNTVTQYPNPFYFDAKAGYENTGSWPAESVSWAMICDGVSLGGPWLDYASNNLSSQFRLPTEAEWEYAYRAGTTTAYHGYPSLPGGSNDGSDSYVSLISWCNDKTQPQAVGLKNPNGFGLYDMGGNVAEWVSDWYGSTYPAEAQTDPTGPTSGTQRVFRCGSYSEDLKNNRSSSRSGSDPSTTYKSVGLRVVMDP